ncbi:hypothetical protein HAX54_018050 [Datura stramonium]|uniref:Uncharacterized protein n=1 Tax=Datura stramonium TaxID=4076 RepID=A0ABS8S0X8_DATST|nr:hypothetical protein [Datura stramonium]
MREEHPKMRKEFWELLVLSKNFKSMDMDFAVKGGLVSPRAVTTKVVPLSKLSCDVIEERASRRVCEGDVCVLRHVQVALPVCVMDVKYAASRTAVAELH